MHIVVVIAALLACLTRSIGDAFFMEEQAG